MNILVGPVSSYKSIVIANYIKDHYLDIKIIGYDFKNIFKYVKSKHFDIVYKVGSIDKTFVDDITVIMDKENISFYFPTSSLEINTIIKNSNLMKHSSLRYLGSVESYDILNDKQALSDFAQNLNIKTPRTIKQFDNELKRIVIKPTNSSSSKGVVYLSSEEGYLQAENYYKDLNQYIIQEYVAGDGIGYSVFCKNGIEICGYAHKRLAEYPVSGGSSTYRTGIFDEEVLSELRSIVKILLKESNWSGFAMFEFKLTTENDLYLIEVNPRIWGSINQGLQNGVNYFESLLGVPDKTNLNMTKMYNTYLSPLIYLSLFQYFLKGDLSKLILFFKNIFFNRADINILSDFNGWLSIILRKII